MRQGLPNNYRISGYTIVKQVGEGGFAYTYLIKNDGGEFFILKELFPQEIVLRSNDFTVRMDMDGSEHRAAWEASIDNFKDEARALRGLNIDTVPQLIDSFSANNTLYIVQNYVDGQELDELTNTFQKLSDKKKNEYAHYLLRHLLNTLSDVHDEGILHRDIKPSNIIIRRNDEVPVLIDFGGVRFQIGGHTYRFNKRIWSPGFSSPEQISTQGMEQSQSSDLYALAATMYALMFSSVPPDASERMIKDTARKFASLESTYDSAFLQSLECAFHLDRDKRFKTAEEWVSTLVELEFKSKKYSEYAIDISKSKPVFIGREPGIGGVALKTSNRNVSRRHLEVRKVNKSYLLIDHSTNGTWLIDRNGKKTKVISSRKIDSLDYSVDLAGDILELNKLINI